MIRVQLRSDRYSPDRHEVTVRTAVDGWQADFAATFASGFWSVDLVEPAYEAGFEFKFRFNGLWQGGPNLVVPAGAGRVHTFDDVGLQPAERPEPVGPLPERGRVQAMVFPDAPPPWEPDVVVIGSGMGGGTVAERLSDLGLKVLVLEAGGLLFPTHVGNLPRRHRIGEFDKHLWQLWPDLRAAPFRPGGTFQGGQGFHLGGRSLVWGGLIPRMTSWELDFWPRQVKWDLEDTYYEKAEALTGKSTAPDTLYNQAVHQLLARALPDFAHRDAPMAVRGRAEGSNWIAGGLFSTADLLMESVLTPGPFGKDNLHVLLNHDVVTIEPDADPPRIRARDLLSGAMKEFTCRRIVLAAGTIESAKIAARSGLSDPQGLIGRGITDHPIYFAHFRIPSTSALYDRFGNVKTLSAPKERPGVARDPFNVVLELGSDFNQGRYLDASILAEHLRRRDTSMLCEVVFLCHQELIEANRLVGLAGPGAEDVQMAPAAIPGAVMDRVKAIRDALLGELGGELLGAAGGAPSEGLAPLGGVAHEVGTLRMRVEDGGRVAAGAPKKPGLVDEDGRFVAHPSLYVCDLSMFPTSPAANPSLTLVALALRLADRLRTLL